MTAARKVVALLTRTAPKAFDMAQWIQAVCRVASDVAYNRVTPRTVAQANWILLRAGLARDEMKEGK